MAESGTLERVREELTCAVCQELFTSPKTLPCLHSYCEACLESCEKARRRMRAKDDGPDSVECPSCRAVTEQKDGVAGITTNFNYVNLIELVQIHSQVMSEETLMCGKCKDDPEAVAVAFCYDCSAALCALCYQAHQNKKELSSHNFLTLEAIKATTDFKTAPTKSMYYCQKHKGELLKLYCSDCHQVICRDCTITARDHRDHKYDFVKDVIGAERVDFEQKLQPLVEMIEHTGRSVAAIKERVAEVKHNQEKRFLRVNEAVDHSLHLLTERRARLQEEAQRVFDVKSKNLSLQLEDIEGHQCSVTSILDLAKTTLESGSDIEILLLKKQIRDRTVSFKILQQKLPFEVKEEDHIHFVHDIEPIEQFGKLCEAPFAEKSVAEGPGLEGPMQGEETSFTVQANSRNGLPLLHGGGLCSAEISCRPSVRGCELQTFPTKVMDNCDGTYSVRFNPSYPGINRVKVLFDDTEIDGSPFGVRVARNYTRPIGEPHVFSVPNASPWGLAMISDTELAITASDCLVHIYTIEGEQLGIIKSNFTRPYGISTDDNGFLWITDREAHTVSKFSRIAGTDFQKLYQFGSRGVNGGQFSHPRGVAVDPNSGMIYVSDMKNHRIQIFKPDGNGAKYHAQFGGPGKNPGLFSLPAGICFDRREQLVICDDHNCRLQVFDKEGNFLQTLGTTRAEKGLLCSPIGIGTDFYGRYIVTEFGSHCVTFISPEGDILNCIRTAGKGCDQFVHPRGITVDASGYVYVADNENMRIVRF